MRHWGEMSSPDLEFMTWFGERAIRLQMAVSILLLSLSLSICEKMEASRKYNFGGKKKMKELWNGAGCSI